MKRVVILLALLGLVPAYSQAQQCDPAAPSASVQASLSIPDPLFLIPAPINGPCTASWGCPCGLVASCSGRNYCLWGWSGTPLSRYVECDGRKVTCASLCDF